MSKTFDLTYKDGKSGRTLQVGEWETVRRRLLEANGWYQAPAGEASEEMADLNFNYAGVRYTVETLPNAPRQFLLELEKRGSLPEGIEIPEGAPLGETSVDDVHGVGEELGELLRAQGIITAGDLAQTDPADLLHLPGIGKKTAPRLVEEAKQLVEGE